MIKNKCSILFNFKYFRSYSHSKALLCGIKPCDRFAFKLSKTIEDGFHNGEFTAKNHPGKMQVKCVYLPTELMERILDIKAEREYPAKTLEADVDNLMKHIWYRRPEYEDDQLKNALDKSAAKLISKGQLRPLGEDGNEISVDDLSPQERKKLKISLKQHVYNWKPLEFTEYSSFIYMWSRMAPDYAALVNVLSEIKKRAEQFSPKTLFDFGSGVGSVSWAVNSVWPGQCQEVYNVDTSPSMNELSERLQKPENSNDSFIKNIYYRQFLPTSENIKYDLVVSSRTFFDLGNIQNRAKTVDILWRKVAPGGFLVLIESGNIYGYSVVLSLRDYLLEICKVEREKYGLNSPIHVFSPCPHDLFCPRYNHKSRTACSFNVTYQPMISGDAKRDKYSYVVLQKCDRPESEQLPRIVQSNLKKKSHVISRVCTPQGNIRELVTTKTKHGISCYQINKNCEWGDFLPVRIDQDTTQSGNGESKSEPELEESQDRNERSENAI